MPLDDALGLVDRDFTRYTMSVREGRIPPRRPVAPKNEVASLLGQAASGEQLTPSQLQQVIDALQKQKHVNGRLQLESILSPLFHNQEEESCLVMVRISSF